MQQEDFIKIEKIIDEKIQTSASHYFGLIKEDADDKFKALFEGQQNILEFLERNLREHREEIDQSKLIIDDNSLAILDHDSRIKILERKNKKLYV